MLRSRFSDGDELVFGVVLSDSVVGLRCLLFLFLSWCAGVVFVTVCCWYLTWDDYVASVVVGVVLVELLLIVWSLVFLL